MRIDFDRLVAEAEAVTLEGWDFSFLEGRVEVAPEPWDYRTRVGELASTVGSLLDIGTGGGEFVASLDRRPQLTVATEAWMPNVPVAATRLEALGVHVVADEGAPDNVAQGHDTTRGRLAFRDESFDAVINRHTSFVAREVARVLANRGTFITQQVGGLNEIELNDALTRGRRERVRLSRSTLSSSALPAYASCVRRRRVPESDTSMSVRSPTTSGRW